MDATGGATVVAIFGPTGSGKTDVAVHVARQLGTVVVNCDPAQCYEGLPTLTNKPQPEHDAVAPHRLVGIWPLTEQASAAKFARVAHRQIDELVSRNGSVVLCGGSGLYMRAALSHLSWGAGEDTHAGGPDEQLRGALHEQYRELGGQALLARLAERDPRAAAGIHPHDEKRVVRALEASQRDGTVAPAGSTVWDAPCRRPTLVTGLVADRALLRERIALRTQRMFEQGLLQEVTSTLGPAAEGYEAISHTAQRLHGLEDCVRVLRGALDEQEGRRLMVNRTRQYAKRQDIWARRWPGLVPVPVDLEAFDAPGTATLLLSRARAGSDGASSRGGGRG